MLSHGNFWYKAREYLSSLGCVAANALAGSTQILMEIFEPQDAMRLIQAERVTIFSGVPTMFITILGHPRFGEFDLRSLRTGTIGAAPVPVEMGASPT